MVAETRWPLRDHARRIACRSFILGGVLVGVVLTACGGGSETTTTAASETSIATTSTTSPGSPTTLAATTTTVDLADVALVDDLPLIQVANYNGTGGFAENDGVNLMFSNQYLRWPPLVQVRLFTSTDGVTWEADGEDPVIDFNTTPLPASIASGVIHEPDGTWTMFFYSYEGARAGIPVSFGRATALEPGGPWTIDPQPVFTRGEGWDSGAISTPTVIRTETGYVMFYTGGTGDGVTSIGRADSADGISWERYDEPIFTGSGEADGWDSLRVSQPNLFVTDSGVVIVYKGNSVASLGHQHGLACAASLEPDAAWSRVGDGPIVDESIVFGGQMIFSTDAAMVDGQAVLYISVSQDPNNIRTAVFGLRLPVVDRLVAEGAC